MQISSAVLALSLVLILNKKRIGEVCQLFLVFSPAYISGLIILLASLRFLVKSQQQNSQQLFSVSRRIFNEGFIAIGRSALESDPDMNIAIVIVNSFSLLITLSSLTYIFR